jgi:hypothetical protein
VAKVTAFEVLGEELDILVYRRGGFGCKSDVVNVDGDNDPNLTIGVDVDRAIRFNAFESQLSQDRVELLVPLTCRLLESIQGFDKSTYAIGTTNVEALRLLHVDLLIKITIGEGRRDVHRS